MKPFEPFAATVAWVAALGGVVYAIAFVVLKNDPLAAGTLLVGGILTSLLMMAISISVADVNEAAARWGFVVGVVAALGSALHGGYDLANELHPPPALAGFGDFPKQVDPRGLATFGLAGLALLTLTTLMSRSTRYPTGLARLGQALGAIMIIIWLGRMIILDPNNPIVRVALGAGVIANTAFFVWLGRVWRSG